MSLKDKLLQKIQELNKIRSQFETSRQRSEYIWLPRGKSTIRFVRDVDDEIFAVGYVHTVNYLTKNEEGENQVRYRPVLCPRTLGGDCPICDLRESEELRRIREAKLVPEKEFWGLSPRPLVVSQGVLISTDADVDWNPGEMKVILGSGQIFLRGFESYLTTLVEDFASEIDRMFDPSSEGQIYVTKVQYTGGAQGQLAMSPVPKVVEKIELPDWYNNPLSRSYLDLKNPLDQEELENLARMVIDYYAYKAVENTSKGGAGNQVRESSEDSDVITMAPKKESKPDNYPECFANPDVFDLRSQKCRTCPVKAECATKIASM